MKFFFLVSPVGEVILFQKLPSPQRILESSEIFFSLLPLAANFFFTQVSEVFFLASPVGEVFFLSKNFHVPLQISNEFTG